MQDVDDDFYNRADAHINLSNDQMTEDIGRGNVSASFMYGVARYNSYVTACGYENSAQMKEDFEENIEYFVSEYKKMLVENMEDYISNFDKYTGKEVIET